MAGIAEEYQLGSLFWAKVGSHPWWPCMIYNPPDGRFVMYHVQFLGPLVERAWLAPSSLIPFTGKKKFDEYVKDKLLNCKDKSERIKFESKSVSSNKAIWAKSWKEAESAMVLTPNERIEKFGRITVKTKSRRIDKAEEEKLLELMSNVPLTIEEEVESLGTFLREETDSRMSKNLEFDHKVLEEELRTQWSALDIATKRKYIRDQLGIFDDALQKYEKAHRKGREEDNKTSESSKSAESNTSLKRNRKSVDSHNKQTAKSTREFDIEIHRLIVSPAQYRLQPVCPVCEIYSNVPGQMFKCRGICGRVVHPRCMRYKNPPPSENSRPEKFRCPQCLTGTYLCSVCGKPDESALKNGPLFPCQVLNCGRQFHRNCLNEWPATITKSNDKLETRTGGFQILRCPAHECNTCFLESTEDDPLVKKSLSKTPLLQCVRCPAVFHTGDLCTPAGSVEVSLSHIVCPRHFDQPLQNLLNFKTQNPNWCFHCYKSGQDRVMCKFCPRTYHKSCIQSEFGTLTGETFLCISCQRGLFPRYAQIIWAKIPSFRWWPCEIIHARNAPINILNMSHPEGSFPVHFLGSDEYQWISRNRVFPYEIGLQTTAAKDTSGSNKIEKAFSRSLHRAPRAHALYVNHVLKRGLPLSTLRADKLPDGELLPLSAMDALNAPCDMPGEDTNVANAMSSFAFIHTNVYADNCLKKCKQNLELEKCLCVNEYKPNDKNSNRSCSYHTKCVHFMAKVECTPTLCSFGSNVDCGNRRFAAYAALNKDKNQPPNFSLIRTINRGFGLKTHVAFKQGEFVMEYVGEVIDLVEANRRLLTSLGGVQALASISSARKGFEPEHETYLMRLGSDLDLVIDAAQQGNWARFINHACDPNLTVERWTADGVLRLGLFAFRPIEANEELTVNYVTSEFLCSGLMAASSICLCGSDSCLSTLRLPSSYTPFVLPEKPSAVDISKCANQTTLGPLTAASDKRKSKKLEESVVKEPPVTVTAPTDVLSKVKPVTSMLSAGATQAQARKDRNGVLISPLRAVARATASDPQKSSTPSDGPVQSVATNQMDENVLSDMVGLGPPLHEDFCYRCGDGGELVLCDKSNCSKSYHLNCLGLSMPPAGIWYCPSHYCDTCGHPSTHMCWRCPNSYCEEHAHESVIQIDDLDRERWELAQSGMNQVTRYTIISSVRWICTDHAGLKIQGPSNRPHLGTNKIDTRADTRHSQKSSDESQSTAVGHNNHLRSTSNGDDEEERENIVPSTTLNGLSEQNGKSETARRLEPLKVKLKRKFKEAEMMAAKQNGDEDVVNGGDAETGRKRPANGSPMVVDKKRSRLFKETPSK